MELKELLSHLKKNSKYIILSGLVFGFFGLVLYFYLPVNYYAEGSIFVSRTVENPSPEFFTYEGYYGQQAALSYSHTVVALLDSVDIKKKVLVNLGQQVNEQSLRKLDKRINLKKPGPQLITVTVKGKSAQEADSTWNVLVNATLEIAERVNQEGDPTLNIYKIDADPVIRQSYRNVFLNIFGGFVLGSIFSFCLISLREYLK